MIENTDELKREAERVGLAKLMDGQPAQFIKAKESAEKLISSTKQHLHMYDEPAHIFRTGEEDV